MKSLTAKTVATGAFVLVATMAYAQDIEAGKAAFRKCVACHATDTTTNKVGPHLGDVIGRTAGTVEGFNYSKAMKDAGAAGLVWDDAHLTEYLVAPKAKVPGTKMAFAGIKKPDELANLVAYLKTLPE
ncbi:cytochrome c family protein [Mesorhizobium sp. J428]|uniref:c-type cytochrome n=1 Tax=Mesorhizobium sp. J428 TaxID=2898440 RepID=UPI0035B0FF19